MDIVTQFVFDYTEAVNISRATIAANSRFSNKLKLTNDTLVHNVATHIWEKVKRGKFDSSKRFGPWASRVARNHLVDMARRNLVRKKIIDTECEEVAENLPSRCDEFPPDREQLPQPTLRSQNRMAAMMVYKHDNRLSYEKLWVKLFREPHIAKQLGYEKPPGVNTLQRIPKRLEKWYRDSTCEP